MTPPIRSEPITANGMFRRGLVLSPPSWTACSNPTMAKITPPAESASKIPFSPKGANPPSAVRLLPWNPTTNSAARVTMGTATFHHTMAALVLAIRLTPHRLTRVNSTSSTAATA